MRAEATKSARAGPRLAVKGLVVGVYVFVLFFFVDFSRLAVKGFAVVVYALLLFSTKNKKIKCFFVGFDVVVYELLFFST